mmetsp:Transcript_16909/g.33515  ORF Transcript_16909/g.33515 Transcript_16909/m.33515 type:complete len:98 (+) Transcript_16909:878-1171(+)
MIIWHHPRFTIVFSSSHPSLLVYFFFSSFISLFLRILVIKLAYLLNSQNLNFDQSEKSPLVIIIPCSSVDMLLFGAGCQSIELLTKLRGTSPRKIVT